MADHRAIELKGGADEPLKAGRDPFEVAAEDYLERRRQGENPVLSENCDGVKSPHGTGLVCGFRGSRQEELGRASCRGQNVGPDFPTVTRSFHYAARRW